jgi:hypothetical protein
MFPGFSFWIVQRLDLQGSLSSLLGSRNGRCHMPSSNEVDQPLAGRLILFCGSMQMIVDRCVGCTVLGYTALGYAVPGVLVHGLPVL